MADSPAPPPVVAPAAAKPRIPFLTWIVCALCGAVFLGLHQTADPYSWDALSKWGACQADRIRDGAVWGLVTSVFVHIEIWHVAFNVYWLWKLGSQIEIAIGHWAWLAVFLATAISSSLAELAVAGQTGIGASGVGYGFFGFMWLSTKRFPQFRKILDQRTIGLFLLWLVGCMIMTLTDVWSVGNAAHVGGLLFGAGLGVWLVHREKRRWVALGLVVGFVLVGTASFWAPWSGEWTAHRGVRAHEKGDYRTAIRFYQRSLELGFDKAWCWENIALAYYGMGDLGQYQNALTRLRDLDGTAARRIEAETTNTSPR